MKKKNLGTEKKRKFSQIFRGKCLSGIRVIQNTNGQDQKRNSPQHKKIKIYCTEQSKLKEKDQVTYKGRPIRMTQTS